MTTLTHRFGSGTLVRTLTAVLGAAAVLQIWMGPNTWHRNWPLTIVIVALAIPVIVRPELVKRLRPTNVKVFGVEVAFANPYEPGDEAEQPDPSDAAARPADEEARWVAAQMKIQWKLAYLIKHTLPAYEDARKPQNAPHVAFATTGSLLYDNYLDPAEAERINFVLICPWALLSGQSTAERAELLALAENLAQTVRAKVLKRLVMKDLRASPGPMSVEDEDANGKLVVRFPSGDVIDVWPTWGRSTLSLVKSRLKKLESESGNGIVVTPFKAPAVTSPYTPADGVRLVSLSDLPILLT